jgi:hypothetical protein
MSELAFTLALSGGPSMSSTKAIAASAGLGAVDFLCVFGIRNKSEKAAPNRGLNSPLFIRVFIAPPTIAYALGISLSQNDNGTASTTHRK